jgi:hypothetical protein
MKHVYYISDWRQDTSWRQCLLAVAIGHSTLVMVDNPTGQRNEDDFDFDQAEKTALKDQAFGFASVFPC